VHRSGFRTFFSSVTYFFELIYLFPESVDLNFNSFSPLGKGQQPRSSSASSNALFLFVSSVSQPLSPIDQDRASPLSLDNFLNDDFLSPAPGESDFLARRKIPVLPVPLSRFPIAPAVICSFHVFSFPHSSTCLCFRPLPCTGVFPGALCRPAFCGPKVVFRSDPPPSFFLCCGFIGSTPLLLTWFASWVVMRRFPPVL